MSAVNVPEAPREHEGETVREAILLLRRRWRLVAGILIACVAISVLLSASREKVYASSAQVLFGQAELSDATFGVNRGSTQPERDAATQLLVATSAEVERRARRTLGTAAPAALGSHIIVQAADNANILTFEGRAAVPRQAADIANAYAQGYLAFITRSQTQELDDQLATLRKQLTTNAPTDPANVNLQAQLNTLVGLRVAAGGGGRLIGTARPSGTPVSPRPKRNAILAAILGLVLAVALVLVLDTFDRRVRSPEEFERLYGLPLLAAVPTTSFAPRDHDERIVGFEPFRVLRNTLGFLELSQTLDVLVVTSAVASEGKSTVAANLARAMAFNGQNVVLVEADLRRPSLGRDLKLAPDTGGLTEALVHQRATSELLLQLDPRLPGLRVLPAGVLPPNAAELLRSPRLSGVLAELKATGARVIVDTPPLLAAADAQGLLDHPDVDGAILVARQGHTTADACRRTRAVLNQRRLEPLGLVVTGVEAEAPYGSDGVDPEAPSLLDGQSVDAPSQPSGSPRGSTAGFRTPT